MQLRLAINAVCRNKMQEKCTQRTQSDRTPLRGKEADRAILAKNSVWIYTILCSKAWLYSERMKK